MIHPPPVRPEEPIAVTPHDGICGGESQQWPSYPTNPHVQFDERGRETERCRMAQATAPVLDSTDHWRSRSINIPTPAFPKQRRGSTPQSELGNPDPIVSHPDCLLVGLKAEPPFRDATFQTDPITGEVDPARGLDVVSPARGPQKHRLAGWPPQWRDAQALIRSVWG